VTEVWMLRMRRKCLSENGGCCGIERNLVPPRQRPKRLSILIRGRCGNVIQEPHNCWNCGSEPSAGLLRLLSWREPETQEWGYAAPSLLRRQCDKISTEASEKNFKISINSLRDAQNKRMANIHRFFAEAADSQCHRLGNRNRRQRLVCMEGLVDLGPRATHNC
jgi:hypothetical protein